MSLLLLLLPLGGANQCRYAVTKEANMDKAVAEALRAHPELGSVRVRGSGIDVDGMAVRTEPFDATV